MLKKAAAKVSDMDPEKSGQQEQQSFLLRFSDALRTENTPGGISNLALQMLFDHLELDCCYIGIFHLEDDYGEFPYQVQTAKFPPLPKGVRLSDFPDALLKSFTSTLVANDILEEGSLSETDKQSFAAMGYRGLVVATVRKGEKNPLWSIVAVSGQPRIWLQEEIKLVEEAAERTWAAVERAKSEGKLKDSESKYRLLFESIDEGFCIIEMIFDDFERPIDYRFLEINPAFDRQSGFKITTGMRMKEIAPLHEDHWFETYGRIAKTGKAERFENYARQLHRWFDVYAFRYGNPENKQVAVVFTDITQRKKFEEDLKKYNETLEENVRKRTDELEKLNEALLKSNKELEYFAYVASHDLQEPLRMVSSFTQLLEKQYGDKLDDTAKEYIGFAVDGAKRMYELINGLLAYSRITRKEKLFTEVDLNEVIDEVKENLELVISERNCLIESEDLPVVSADKTQMIQLFQNLVSNGIKFSTGNPHIIISATKEHSGYVISVKDEGIGIEPQYFDKIFQIFQRLHQRDQFEGTGIGLAICRKIVEDHNGRIWLESEPGRGSVFYFTLGEE